MTSRVVQIVCPAGVVSGKEVASLTLAGGLRNSGFDPRFMISVWSNGEFPRQLDAKGFARESLPFGFISLSLRPDLARMTFGQLQRWPELVRKFRRLVAATKPQAVIHANWHHALLLLPLLDPRRDIYWAHEFAPATGRYAVLFRALAARVKRIVCVSHAVERNLLSLGVARDKLAVVHNGIEPVCGKGEPPAKAPLRLGIVGQVTDWKGHEDLFAALCLLAKNDVACELSVFGGGMAANLERMKAKASEMGIGNIVRWRGFVPERADIYRQIDVCVAPSRDPEPFGMSALEANAFGRPVVCTASGGLGEIVEDGRTGIVVAPRQPHLLAEAIARLARDPGLCAAMGEAGRRRAQGEFAEKQFAEQFGQIIANGQA